MEKTRFETEKYIVWVAGHMCASGMIEIENVGHFLNEVVPEIANKLITNCIICNDNINKYLDKIEKELLLKYGVHEFMINYEFEDDEEIE